MAPKLQTVDRTIEIVQYMSRKGEVTATEISDEFELPTSTTSDYLTTLRENELIIKDGRSYRLNCRFLELGSKTRWNLGLFRTARPDIDALAEDINERVYLMKVENRRGVTLYTARGNPRVKVSAYDGLHTPLHTTAGGKAILAHLSKDRLREIYPDRDLCAINEHTITAWDELLNELESIRESGVAYEREERVDGISSVAAPIMDRDDVLGSVACFGPTSRIEQPEQEDGSGTGYGNRMREVANIIEVNMRTTQSSQPA